MRVGDEVLDGVVGYGGGGEVFLAVVWAVVGCMVG